MYTWLLLACKDGTTTPKGDDSAEGTPDPTPDPTDTAACAVMALSPESLYLGPVSSGAPVEGAVTLSNEGDGTLGIGAIAMGPDATGFAVSWDVADAVCPSGSEAGTVGGGDPFTLGAGCAIPITVTHDGTGAGGDRWGAVLVESMEDATDGTYQWDDRDRSRQVHVHAEVDAAAPRVHVRPRSLDFGFVWPGTDAASGIVTIGNVGTADLEVVSVSFGDGCADFGLVTDPSGTTILPGTEAEIRLAFVPASFDTSYCSLYITTTDALSDVVDTVLTGNSPGDDTPPELVLVSPPPGGTYADGDTLRLDVLATDAEQPVETLDCEVRSFATGELIRSCWISSSGDNVIEVDVADLDDGTDTVVLDVVDSNGGPARAAVSVLVDADRPEDDADEDAYAASGDDCDDTDPSAYPGADEVPDGADNDCDGLTDEGTELSDDDGDGRSESEGDCDDDDPTAWPGAPEAADGTDDDCDGLTDEGTSLYDDDGDGFSEFENDCDDSDPAVNPAATEWCDGVDNDCDGLRDSADGCVPANTTPTIVGADASPDSCHEGDVIVVAAFVHDADGQVPTIQWNDDSGEPGLFGDETAASTTWTCPSAEGTGSAYNLIVQVVDPDGHPASTFLQVDVHADTYAFCDP